MTRRSWPRRAATTPLLALAVVAVLAGGCGSDDTPSGAGSIPTDCGPAPEPTPLRAEVLAEHPHDPTAFTQGLVVVDGALYESTGRRGHSSVREVDLDSGRVLRSTDLDLELFGEGLTAVGDDRLVQLTWTEGRALVWNRSELTAVGEHRYDGEGWGISTLDDGRLVMSDGSDTLTVRDPDDFSVLERWQITRADGAADRLNELEWDGERLWANRWQTDEIVRIDLRCRRVDGVLDASALTARAATAAAGRPIDVLNGIAHLPDSGDLLLTGKYWPLLFEVAVTEDARR